MLLKYLALDRWEMKVLPRIDTGMNYLKFISRMPEPIKHLKIYGIDPDQ